MENAATLFDWTPPERASGIEASVNHAEYDQPGWRRLALDYVNRYAATHREFVSEDCTDWAFEQGLPIPAEKRAMGQIYRDAKSAKIIAKVSNEGWSKKRASPTVLWRSCHPNFAEMVRG